MTKGAKVGLVVGGVVLACCAISVGGLFLLVRTVTRAVVADPAAAARIGREIAEYTPPEGYREQMALDMFGAKVVAIAPAPPQRKGVLLALMQLPPNAATNPQDAERRLREMWTRNVGRRGDDVHVVGLQQVTVRGRPVTLTVGEGNARNGSLLREIYGVLPNERGGPVMFMAMGAKESWNQVAVDEFLASIR
jgi:hypothetical protein